MTCVCAVFWFFLLCFRPLPVFVKPLNIDDITAHVFLLRENLDHKHRFCKGKWFLTVAVIKPALSWTTKAQITFCFCNMTEMSRGGIFRGHFWLPTSPQCFKLYFCLLYFYIQYVCKQAELKQTNINNNNIT